MEQSMSFFNQNKNDIIEKDYLNQIENFETVLILSDNKLEDINQID